MVTNVTKKHRDLAAARYQFDWDPAKAVVNLAKHGVAFEAAMTVFLDPLARSRFDEDNSDEGDRFVTLGEAKNGQLLVVAHTYVERKSAPSCPYPYRFGSSPDGTRSAAIPRRNRAMKDEYDFSDAERGKFYRPGAQLIPPVHLDPEVLSYLAARAEARGTSLNNLVNELLRKDIELIEAAR
jgi:uncharacterized DUF497 family protein